MGEGDVEDPLKSLEKKIEDAKKGVEPQRSAQNKFSAAEVGWRMIIELTAGVFIGFGLGYGLDFLFDTQPVFILLLTLFGFAAGVKTMMLLNFVSLFLGISIFVCIGAAKVSLKMI